MNIFQNILIDNQLELFLEKLNTIESLLKHLVKQDWVIDTTPINDILSVTHAAEYLCLSKSSLYKMTSGTKSGLIKADVFFRVEVLSV